MPKAKIIISGQPQGNNIIARAIPRTDEKSVLHTIGNGFVIEYPSKSQARKALQAAYDRLTEEEPEYSHIVLNRDRLKLSYDASIAYVS